MDLADAKEISALKKAEKEAKEKEQEQLEIGLAIGGIFFVLFLVFVGIYELTEFCQTTRRCGR
jgi:flagellar biogenesis protein FliO